MGEFTATDRDEHFEKLVRHDRVFQTPATVVVVFQFQMCDRRKVGEKGTKMAVLEVSGKVKMGKPTMRVIEQ
jgi:hypothetical protein